MAVMPGAKWRPLPENSSQGAIVPTQIILHTAVDGPATKSLFGFFSSRSVSVESHFYVTKGGAIEQYIDTTVRADANYGANHRAISIETWDGGDPELNPWTEAQLISIEKIIRWCSAEHGIPLRLCPSHDAAGVGYHSQFGFGDPVNLVDVRANPWSPSRGKTCPGRTRVGQIYDVLMPRLESEQEDNPMHPEDARSHVVGLYEVLLGRAPEESEISYWTEQVANKGLSRDDLLWFFIVNAGEELARRRETESSAIELLTTRIEVLRSRVDRLSAIAPSITDEIVADIEAEAIDALVERLKSLRDG